MASSRSKSQAFASASAAGSCSFCTPAAGPTATEPYALVKLAGMELSGPAPEAAAAELKKYL